VSFDINGSARKPVVQRPAATSWSDLTAAQRAAMLALVIMCVQLAVILVGLLTWAGIAVWGRVLW
jgi:hypothetical protein